MKASAPKASPFTNVAHVLANGKPLPEWLIRELEQTSEIVGNPRKAGPADEDDDKALLAAVKDLERRLVWEVHVHELIEKKWPWLPAPMIFDETANKLFELAQYLESQRRPPRKGGQTPDSRRRVCAGVCAEAWRRLHGEVQPFSVRLWQACEEYWQACGHPETSTSSRLKNWEPFLKWGVTQTTKDRPPPNSPEKIGVTAVKYVPTCEH